VRRARCDATKRLIPYGWELAFAPTAAERTDGFELDIDFSGVALADQSRGLVVDGFTLDIHTAFVLGQ